MNRTSQELTDRALQVSDDCPPSLKLAILAIVAALCELRDSIDAIPWRDVGRDEPEYFQDGGMGNCDTHISYHAEQTGCKNWKPITHGHP